MSLQKRRRKSVVRFDLLLNETWPVGASVSIRIADRVSREVILGRFLHLDLITWKTYDKYLNEIRKSYRLHSGDGGHFYRTTVRNNGYSYTRLVLEAQSRSVISLGDACDFLNIKVNHMPGIERVLRQAG